jgi:predicted DNA-binding protein YlxM (UPF0122 family)
LSEISEPEGKTRQNVYESLKKVKEKLFAYENVLGLYKKNKELLDVVVKLEDDQIKQQILDIIGR